MSRRHADDLVFYATLGIILGGRLGYVLFYNLPYYAENPLDALQVWHGGMSFHGGMTGVLLAIVLFCWRRGLSAKLVRSVYEIFPAIQSARAWWWFCRCPVRQSRL